MAKYVELVKATPEGALIFVKMTVKKEVKKALLAKISQLKFEQHMQRLRPDIWHLTFWGEEQLQSRLNSGRLYYQIVLRNDPAEMQATGELLCEFLSAEIEKMIGQ